MIKEIEVGGVKHSITLADDMIGSGLMRSGSGMVCLNLPTKPVGEPFVTGLVVESGKLCINKHSLCASMVSTGLLRVDGVGKLFIDTEKLAGTGLKRSNDGNALYVSASGLVSDMDFMNQFASGLVGTGLFNDLGKLIVSGEAIAEDAGFMRRVSSGLIATPGFAYALSSGIAGHLAGPGLTDSGGRLSIDRGLFGSGLYMGVGESSAYVAVGRGLTIDESLSPKPVCVKIVTRSSGLRLIFNSAGELDVTQN